MKTAKVFIGAALAFVGLFASAHEASALTVIAACQPLTSGSYVLNADVTAAANSPCFTIMADNVALNLGGHTVTAGGVGVAAITDGAVSRRALTVESGTIVADVAIDLLASSEVRIESLNIDAGALGIAAGPYSKLLGNLVNKFDVGIEVQCPALLVWNNVAQGKKNFVELGKGCKKIHNVSGK